VIDGIAKARRKALTRMWIAIWLWRSRIRALGSWGGCTWSLFVSSPELVKGCAIQRGLIGSYGGGAG
jgi:hypothetical protein